MTRTSPGCTVAPFFISFPNWHTVLPTLSSPAVTGISVFIASRMNRTSLAEAMTSPGAHETFHTEAYNEEVTLKLDSMAGTGFTDLNSLDRCD